MPGYSADNRARRSAVKGRTAEAVKPTSGDGAQPVFMNFDQASAPGASYEVVVTFLLMAEG